MILTEEIVGEVGVVGVLCCALAACSASRCFLRAINKALHKKLTSLKVCYILINYLCTRILRLSLKRNFNSNQYFLRYCISIFYLTIKFIFFCSRFHCSNVTEHCERKETTATHIGVVENLFNIYRHPHE